MFFLVPMNWIYDRYDMLLRSEQWNEFERVKENKMREEVMTDGKVLMVRSMDIRMDGCMEWRSCSSLVLYDVTKFNNGKNKWICVNRIGIWRERRMK